MAIRRFNFNKKLSRTKRGYDNNWLRASRLYLLRNPICVDCGGLATEVDHVKPMSQGGDKYDPENLRGRCKRCHAIKTYKYDGSLGNNKRDPEMGKE